MAAYLGFPFLVASAYYLAARSEIGRPLWSRYPARLDRVARCPACAGFWVGLALALAGSAAGALPWRAVPVLALISVVTTPILWGAMAYGLGAKPRGEGP